MTRRIARGVAIAALIFSTGSLIATLTASVTAGDRVEPGTIVVVGDPTIPGMQAVLTELRGAAARGDPLHQSLVLNATSAIVAVFVLLWLGVAKYADATRAWIRMSATDGHLELEVADDGRGFDLDATGYGTGLQGMVDRLEAIGGSLSVRSTPGAGTTVTGSLLAHAVEATG